jgi:hypothetical protein
MTDIVANAGNVKIVITGDGSNFSQVVADVNKKLEALGVKGRAAGHGMVSSVQAASGSIRILEGNVENNVRAVERFLVSSLKLGPILQAAFPVVGAIAFGGIIAKIGEEVYRFAKAAQDAPRIITQNFASSNSAMRLANDQLALANLRLENETAKLEKKPENHLAEALIASQIEAGKLVESLERVSKAQQDAFKGQHIGYLQQLFGKGGTRDVEQNVANFESQIVGRGQDLQIALDGGDKSGAATARAELQRLQQNYIAYLRDQIKLRTSTITTNPSGPISYASANGDQSANLAILQGALSSTQLSIAQQRLQEQNGRDLAANDTAKGNRDAAREALEAQRQQMEAMKQSADDQLADIKRDHQVSITEEIGYWRSVQAAIKGGGQAAINYRTEVNKKIGDLSEELRKKLELAQGKRDALSTDESGVRQLIEQQKAQYEAVERAIEAGIKQREKMQIGTAELARGAGSLTAADYRSAVADAHTQAFNAQRDDLERQLARLEGLSDQAAQRERLQEQLDELQGNRQLQVAQDAQATSAAYGNPFVGIRDALDDLINASHDLANTWREIAGNAFDTVNGQIVRAISGQRTDLGNAGASIFRSAGGALLKTAEGTLGGEVLKRFGMGGKKTAPTGAAGDALHAWVDNLSQQGAGSVGNLLDTLDGMKALGTEGQGAVGDGLQTITPLLTAAIPFLADGGPVVRNMPAIVGERGPELFVPSGSGHIVPNHKLGGTTHHHHWNIDARGATDPAAVKRMVMQGIAAAAPHLVRLSVAAGVERQRRLPSSKR